MTSYYYPHHHHLGSTIVHTAVRAGIWRLMYRAPILIVIAIVALAVIVAVGQWVLRGRPTTRYGWRRRS